MLLASITFHIHTPKLASHHPSFHSLDICVPEKSFREIELPAIDAVMQFYTQLPREIIMSINQTKIPVSKDFQLQKW